MRGLGLRAGATDSVRHSSTIPASSLRTTVDFTLYAPVAAPHLISGTAAWAVPVEAEHYDLQCLSRLLRMALTKHRFTSQR